MELSTIDLNLLVPLRALLEEKSVSRAAERLHLSQPAVSASLSRLRRYFDDELLIRASNAYHLSPLAEDLLAELPAVDELVSRLFRLEQSFDPDVTTRRFRIMCSDYVTAVIGAELSRIISEAAPASQVSFETVSDNYVDGAPDTLRDIDGIVLPHGYLQLNDPLDLFEDEWVCLLDRENPAAEGLTVDTLGSLPWAATYSGRTSVTTAARHLHSIGIYPATQVVTRSFLALPDVIEGTSRVAFLPKTLVGRALRNPRMAVVDCPVELPTLRHAFWWSQAREKDLGHQWLRQRLSEAAQSVGR
ncbi:LysR family transcriptional regulator [Herbiconiux sp.]|uniref:LysR family transcriptional regulator n=1 Tax=Herbiconiux sp. TaxID=1871186 RepID=UPI0025C21C7C|nr:LysR family transcriptional regulator [Herbiconiux sp.]